jgi:hypothetical protein
MANYVTVAEAVSASSYSHVHISWLLRQGKILGRKSGTLWLVDLDSLLEYEAKMQQLGTQKHAPKSEDR